MDEPQESRNEWHRQLVHYWERQRLQQQQEQLVRMQKIASDPQKIEEYLNG